MRKVRVAVVGCGNVAEKYVPHLHQSGFVYAAQRQDWTVQLIGSGSAMTMGGYAWEPQEISVYRGDQMKAEGAWETFRPQGQETYVWQSGATYIAECLASGEKPRLHGEHAIHVFEVMQAALKQRRLDTAYPLPQSSPGHCMYKKEDEEPIRL